MDRSGSPKKPQVSRQHLPVARIISTDLDLKKSGLVRGNEPHRPRPSLLPRPSLSVQTSGGVDARRAEVQRRLREQEERRRQQLQEMLRQDERKVEQLERRREEMRQVQEAMVKEEEKGKKLNAFKTVHDRFEGFMENLHVKEAPHKFQVDNEPRYRDKVALDTVVQSLKSRQKKGRAAEREKATAWQKRKKDAQLRQRATEALRDRQQRIQEAVRDRNRAELQRLLNLPQPLLEARMPRYKLSDYPANQSMRRLLHQYKRRRIDEVTFNEQAAALASKMSPRRILLHQNQLLRAQQALDRAAEGVSGPGPVSVSDQPFSARFRLSWHVKAPQRDGARRLAERLIDEAFSRAGDLFRHLLERNEVDLVALLDGGITQTFDDEGDLEASLSAFDFGGDLEMDQAAVERIAEVYRDQACHQRSEREVRAFPSDELRTFSSAVLDPGVSCSCTTLSGVDSQCSLCQLAAAKEGKQGGRKEKSPRFPPPFRRQKR